MRSKSRSAKEIASAVGQRRSGIPMGSLTLQPMEMSA